MFASVLGMIFVDAFLLYQVEYKARNHGALNANALTMRPFLYQLAHQMVHREDRQVRRRTGLDNNAAAADSQVLFMCDSSSLHVIYVCTAACNR